MATETANNQVTFYGGPCNGENHFYTNAQLASGVVVCKSVQYVIQGTSPHFYRATTLASQTGASGTAQTFAPDLFRAYHSLARAIGSHLRPAITKAQRYDQLALQSLARHHKVRKH